MNHSHVAPYSLYNIASIMLLHHPSDFPIYYIGQNHPMLIGVEGGRGSLIIDDQTYELSKGDVVFIPTKWSASLLSHMKHTLQVYVIQLGVHSIDAGNSMSINSMSIEDYDADRNKSGGTQAIHAGSQLEFIIKKDVSALVTTLNELYIHRTPLNEQRHLRNQMLLYQIIVSLLESRSLGSYLAEQEGMLSSIQYVQQNYTRKLSRATLAQLAGISEAHYSVVFKQMTGQTFSEYVTALRIHRAIELWTTGTSTLKEIAHEVGYKDEFYLSRRFKKFTGKSPSEYVKEPVYLAAALLYPFTAHLLLLGVQVSIGIGPIRQQFIDDYRAQISNVRMLNIDCSSEQLLSEMNQSDAQMIIASSHGVADFNVSPEQLRVLAPVVDVPWMELGWKQHLQWIASAVRRQKQAEDWLTAFEKEELAAKNQVQRYISNDVTLTIVVFNLSSMLVYGARNVGYVFYQSLGFEPPERIAQLMENRRDQFHCIPIEGSQLVDYAGDYIIAVVFDNYIESTTKADQVFGSEEWHSLEAVQHGRVHILSGEEWLPYDPLAIKQQLQMAVELFTPLI